MYTPGPVQLLVLFFIVVYLFGVRLPHVTQMRAFQVTFRDIPRRIGINECLQICTAVAVILGALKVLGPLAAVAFGVMLLFVALSRL